MTTIVLTIVAIIAAILTIGFVAIPAGVVVGAFNAFRHGGKGREKTR